MTNGKPRAQFARGFSLWPRVVAGVAIIVNVALGLYGMDFPGLRD